MQMFDGLKEFEDALASAMSLRACNEALCQYLEKHVITTFSFTYYSYHPHSSNKLKYETCSSNFKTWHEHYLAEQYQDIDSTLRFVYENHVPIHWDLKKQLAQASNEKERKMREDGLAFGAESGLSIPIHGPLNNFAILLVVQMRDQDCNLLDPNHQYALFVAAQYYYHYIQQHLLDEVGIKESYRLTAREIQCLLLIARQYTVKDMAQALEINERTINFHIQKLNKKLGTRNKYQSLAKALEYQLLTL